MKKFLIFLWTLFLMSLAALFLYEAIEINYSDYANNDDYFNRPYFWVPGDSTGGRYIEWVDTFQVKVHIDSLRLRNANFDKIIMSLSYWTCRDINQYGSMDSVFLYFVNEFSDSVFSIETNKDSSFKLTPVNAVADTRLAGLSQNWSIEKKILRNVKKFYIGAMPSDSIAKCLINIYPEY